MKKRKNKLINFLKTGILFFGISLLLFSCEKEEINFSEKKIIEIIEFNQIDNKITNLIPEVKSKNTQKQKSTSSKENIVFNFKEVVKLIDSLKNTKFTIEFITTNQPENIFYNLVLEENNEGEILEPLIYKYTIDNYYEFKQKLKVGHFKLKGKKEIFNYNSFKNNFNNVNSLAKTNSTPCGGDSAVVEFDSASGGFWWDEYQIKRTYIVFEEDGNFEFPKTSSKSSDDCGGGGSPSGSTPAIIDTSRCPTGFIKDIDTDECVEDKTLDDIIDNTDNPCVSDIIQKLQEKDKFKSLVPNLEGVSHLSQIVLDLFGDCKNYDLEINIAELGTGPNGGLINAETKGIESITLDEDLVDDATKLSIAKTLIHESMHIFINFQINKRDLKSDFYKSLEEYYQKNSTGNLAQHQFMSQFVEALAYSISAYDIHRQDISYYTKLSWGGLEQSDAYKAFSDDKKKEIQTIIKNERDAKSDAKSTKCE